MPALVLPYFSILIITFSSRTFILLAIASDIDETAALKTAFALDTPHAYDYLLFHKMLDEHILHHTYVNFQFLNYQIDTVDGNGNLL